MVSHVLSAFLPAEGRDDLPETIPNAAKAAGWFHQGMTGFFLGNWHGNGYFVRGRRR
jgi:hypothetical protein